MDGIVRVTKGGGCKNTKWLNVLTRVAGSQVACELRRCPLAGYKSVAVIGTVQRVTYVMRKANRTHECSNFNLKSAENNPNLHRRWCARGVRTERSNL